MIGSIKRRFKTQRAFRVLHERQKMIVVTFSPIFPHFLRQNWKSNASEPRTAERSRNDWVSLALKLDYMKTNMIFSALCWL